MFTCKPYPGNIDQDKVSVKGAVVRAASPCCLEKKNLGLPWVALLSVKHMQMTCPGKEWCAPLHPITKLTEHIHTQTNTAFYSRFNPLFTGNKSIRYVRSLCTHWLTKTVWLYPFICSKYKQNTNLGSSQKVRILHRAQLCMRITPPESIAQHQVSYQICWIMTKLVTRCRGAVMSCTTVKSSWRDFERKANGIPACSLRLCRFTGRKYAQVRHVNPLWLRNKAADKDEADILWRRLLYYKIAAASPSERKKDWPRCFHIHKH